ncbi:uncharacterized protein LOC8041089 isoform X1 [Ixodes scapularis]|uniref:uncharacterized protein LOC8041089 isoform X1 n=2 Tax=Ixodes scapularis TaxID=6945 RepID=UPI001C38E5A6|nr:uncharacterized protein LOC8041089 isoform X1 [Ixodes scapularis]
MPSGWSELALQCVSGGICSVTDGMENLRAQNPTVSPASIRIKNMPRHSETGTRFPKLGECAHFHYDMMDLASVQMSLVDWCAARSHDESDKENRELPQPQPIQQPHHHQQQQVQQQLQQSVSSSSEPGCCPAWWAVQVTSRERSWTLRRSYDNFRLLDEQLHRCVYDRQHSRLAELPDPGQLPAEPQQREAVLRQLLSEYLERFSCLVGNLVSCGSVLNWLELDNRGNRLLVTDESAINTPAVAAAYVTRSYQAQAPDEISFQVGDMVSVIDMPPADESTWWRGKRGFEVGFFPSECVQVIGDKIPHNLKIPTKPVLRKHGKLIAFFRSFLLSRPSRRKLKQSGILRERVFGCDLAEHLTNSGRDVPLVLTSCAKFIEQYGIVDGIYRLSGVTSNIQKLRVTFDEDRVPDLNEEEIRQDIHCVASLLKMYFRELPNPLLTYQLYDKFVAAMQLQGNNKLLKIREVVKELPPPHYRTLETLVRHLAVVSAHGDRTGMTAKNVAIVWAPNLLRSKDLEAASVGALHVIGVQAVLTEYLICYVDLIFNDKMPAYPSSPESLESTPRRSSRPKSLAISTPTKLLSLEEARSRVLASNLPGNQQQKYIDVGGGPDSLPAKYHTVIELPHGKRGSAKLKKSPLGWRSFFVRGWHSGSAREKDKRAQGLRKASTGSLPHHQSLPIQDKALTEADLVHSASKQLRSVKSAESLISSGGHSGRNSEILDSCNSSSEASRVQPFQWMPEATPPASSPGGAHKHVRSVSHDSYFERGALDLSLEDLNVTFQFAASHQQQQQPSPPQKSPRKQKLCSDVEGANNPKVQRLGDVVDSPAFQSSHRSAADTFSSAGKMESLSYATSQPQLPTFAADEEQQAPTEKRRHQSSSRSLTPYSSRQPLAVHSPDDIEPYTSPSPQEHHPGTFRTSEQFRDSVQQHGNEKMVLVEVHAAAEEERGSSSQELVDGALAFHRPFVEDVDDTVDDTLCESTYDSATDAEEPDNHVETSLAEDIASSLKMSCCQFDTGFLVGESRSATSLETSFLNRVSASLPYIEDTDTSASPLSSPCAGCEQLPLEVSTRSTPSPIEVQSGCGTVGSVDRLDSPCVLLHECLDCSVETPVPAMPNDELRTFVDAERCGRAAELDVVQRVEALNCGVLSTDADRAVLVVEATKESSTSEEEDNEEVMPYSYLDESPLLSEPYTAMQHSQSQDQSLCLLSPTDGNTDRSSLSPDPAVCVEAGEEIRESSNTPELCIMQVEPSQNEPVAMICDAAQEEEKVVSDHTLSESVDCSPYCETEKDLIWDDELQENKESALLNSSPGIDPNTFELCEPLVQKEATHTDLVFLNVQKLVNESEQMKGVESAAPETFSDFTTSRDTQESPLFGGLQCSTQAQSLTHCNEFINASTTEDLESKPLIEFGDDDVLLRSSSRPPQIVEAKRKSEPRTFGANSDSGKKRLSEPVAQPRSEKRGSVKELMSKFEPTDTQASNADFSPSRTSQPSLFTQLKVMRLQSRKTNPSSPPNSSNYDPWSDPILDDQDNHVEESVCYDTAPRATVDSAKAEGLVEVPEPVVQVHKVDSARTEVIVEIEVSDAQRPVTLDLRKVSAPTQVEEKQVDPVKKPEETVKNAATLPLESEVSRKRIEKFKEERRAQLREKLKSESFRSEEVVKLDVTKQRRTSDGEAPELAARNVATVPLRRTSKNLENQQATDGRSWQKPPGDRKRDLLKQSAESAATEKQPAVPRPQQPVEPMAKRQDLSPPKRIRDRAAMFECRSKKEPPHPQPRLARADLSSC